MGSIGTFSVNCPKCSKGGKMSGTTTPPRMCSCGQDLSQYWTCEHGSKVGKCSNKNCSFNETNVRTNFNWGIGKY